MTAAQLPLSEELNLGVSENLALSKDGIFKTFQGEGPRLGRLTTFMRLAGCNLACSWCDTPYTWDWTGKNGYQYSPHSEVLRLPIVQAAFLVTNVEGGTRSLTITGGEPLLQWHKLDSFFQRLHAILPPNAPLNEVNFETNGTIYPIWSAQALRVAQKFNYVVSPKLKNSGNPLLKDSLRELVNLCIHAPGFGEVDFKFVCESSKDFDEIEQLLTYLSFEGSGPIAPGRIWIMPQGIEPGVINCKAQEMAQAVLNRGWNLTPRFHLQLWGNIRGK